MAKATRKKILIILTGGTIAGNIAGAKDKKNSKARANSFDFLLNNSLENIQKSLNINIKVSDIFNIDSSNILPQNWVAILDKIKDNYDSFDAFIILHGTNTMGYSAAALSFALENINKPVILTGAQVPMGTLGSDAMTNLANALRLAAWPHHSIKGVIAVFGSKIISGVRVKKGTDFDYDPFSSFITGALGQIGRFVRISDTSLNKHNHYLSKFKPLASNAKTLSIKKEFATCSVASLTEFPGMSPEIFKDLVDGSDIKGFVFRAFGAGDASTNLLAGFEYLKKKKIPIVVTSQAPQGIANFQVNEPGKILKDRDLAIPAYDMNIESMTVKMAWLIAQKLSYEEIKKKMLEDLHGEINVENELR